MAYHFIHPAESWLGKGQRDGSSFGTGGCGGGIGPDGLGVGSVGPGLGLVGGLASCSRTIAAASIGAVITQTHNKRGMAKKNRMHSPAKDR